MAGHKFMRWLWCTYYALLPEEDVAHNLSKLENGLNLPQLKYCQLRTSYHRFHTATPYVVRFIPALLSDPGAYPAA